uniref:Uncharacterized protein n=1 Tax=Tanacetum cinerariifolium TaxID=118510 RepID=A0A6L2J6M3_TANCI|nr:hypothetical protein [Tanacetum cinerariifolium]
MLMALKNKVGGNLNGEENDFMLDNAYGDDTLKELSETLIMMAHIQPADNKADAEQKYNAKAISEVNALQINLISGMLSKGVHEHTDHEKCKAVINTSDDDDDQIDFNIIFDDPYEKPNKVYDPYLKAGLGYQNPKRLKKAIAAQPKMYDGERLQSTKLIIDSPDSKETLKDTEESRLKMKDKMIQLDYEKLNALCETFVPQKEIPIGQTYFLTPTSNVSSELSIEMLNLP